MTAPALYIIAAEHRSLAEQMSDTDAPDESLTAALDALTGAFEDKAVACAMVLGNLSATAAAIKTAETEMAKRRKVIERRTQRLNDYIRDAMIATGIKRIDAPHMALSLRACPPAVEVFDEAQVPAEFMRQPEPPAPAPDKAAIKAAMVEGEIVPGCKLRHGMRLEIK